MSQGQRRLAAVMYIDMVGYTALGQRNEFLSIALVEEQRKLVRPILVRHNGREVKTMGDAFLVEFSSALDATMCAYDIQRAAREFNFSLFPDKRIHLRVGVHLGDVVESAGDISGDAVNVASRIESLATDGGVCITRQVYDSVQNKFELGLKSLGMKSLKNVEKPMEVYKMEMPWDDSRSYSPARVDTKRIAVLPFANMSPEPSDEYFADGMTEELIDRLSQLRELRVIARTSVMHYKKKEKSASEIGKELGVQSLVEGSVRKAGNKVRVTVQLIDVRTDEHVWSSRYDRSLDDIFDVQSEIASRVSEELKVHMVESDKRLLEKKPTENTEAYSLYLRGRHYWNERTVKAVEKAIRYLEMAIEADPNFAGAYSGLADCYVILADYAGMPPLEALRRAEEYANKALSLDPDMSQPHAALALAHEWRYQWDVAGREFKRAIELNPNNATAHHWYSDHVALMGNIWDAIEEENRAREADPLSLIVRVGRAMGLAHAGLNEEAERELKLVEEIDPDFFSLHFNRAVYFAGIGQFELAQRDVNWLEKLDKSNIFSLYASGLVAARRGNVDKALGTVEDLKTRKGPGTSNMISFLYAAMGDMDKFFEWAERAIDERGFNVGFAIYSRSPIEKAIRADPRFPTLLISMNLKPDLVMRHQTG